MSPEPLTPERLWVMWRPEDGAVYSLVRTSDPKLHPSDDEPPAPGEWLECVPRSRLDAARAERDEARRERDLRFNPHVSQDLLRQRDELKARAQRAEAALADLRAAVRREMDNGVTDAEGDTGAAARLHDAWVKSAPTRLDQETP